MESVATSHAKLPCHCMETVLEAMGLWMHLCPKSHLEPVGLHIFSPDSANIPGRPHTLHRRLHVSAQQESKCHHVAGSEASTPLSGICG